MPKRRIFEELTGVVMAFAALIGPIAFVVNIICGLTAARMCLLLLPVYILFYIMRLTIKSFWVFVPAHLAVTALSFIALYIDIFLFVILLVFSVAGVIHSFVRKYKGDSASGETSLAIGTVFCLLNAMAASLYGVGKEIVPMSVFLEIMLVAGYLALGQMHKLDMSLAVLSESRPDMDNRRILRFNNTLTAGFIFLAAAAAGLAALLFSGDVFTKIINAVFAAVAMLVWFIITLIPNGNNAAERDEVQQMPDDFFKLSPDVTDSWFSQFIEIAVMVVGTIALFALVAYCIYRLISLLYKSFGAKDATDIEENVERRSAFKHSARSAHRRDFGRGYEKKIRRQYYKTVKRQKDLLPKNTDTTGDILKKSSEDISELTKLYEDVRYRS